MLPVIKWIILIIISIFYCHVNLVSATEKQQDGVILKEISARPTNPVFTQEIVEIKYDGRVFSLTGSILIKNKDQDAYFEVSIGDEVKDGDIVGLSPNSSLLIKFEDTTVSLYSNETARWFVFQKRRFIR